MLKEFNHAQQILKDKIAKLQNMYVFLLVIVTKLLPVAVTVTVV